MSAQWQTGYKSPIIESTGNAFFVKTQENTHAGTKDTLSAQQETREIVCLFYTHLNPVILKKKKKNALASLLMMTYCILPSNRLPIK